MADTGSAPEIPTGLQQYDSYATDPKYQKYFTIGWTAALGAYLLFRIVGLFIPRRSKVWSFVSSIGLWSLPGIGLTVGQLLVIVCYTIGVLACLTTRAKLEENPNRAGFLALAQLPPSSFSPFLAHFTYEKLSPYHRYAGRVFFLCTAIHGGMWINNHLKYGEQILGASKETTGVAAFSLVCILVLSSLKPVRRWAYEVFYIIHILAVPAFLVTISYHTTYARPWVYPPAAFWLADLILRMVRGTWVGQVELSVQGDTTVIQMPTYSKPILPGQHVRVTLFLPTLGIRDAWYSPGHPVTVIPADRGAVLAMKAAGGWTRAVGDYARFASSTSKSADADCAEKPDACPPVTVLAMLSAHPTGGIALPRPLAAYTDVFCMAGGSGASFALSLAGALRGVRRAEVVWCVRSFGSIIPLAPYLARLTAGAAHVHITVYVTCLCQPELIPDIPNCDVVLWDGVGDSGRPSVGSLMKTFVAEVDAKDEQASVAIMAAGPRSLVAEAGNAVARLKAAGPSVEVGYHGEVFDL
ncbi:ferric reductase like transmembrane component-domain-containing protein [Schizophyllum amplum]|uniref:Ferric reductase like transmembrane component-domain-containing protein n=1 Tax=Schizophyllum amplum TaxID=97359 RepID=A0A550C5N5_9AGAR|nr:ferric reductase like transmembrane component-domain-containing protein [Auriculariopsis ampla]